MQSGSVGLKAVPERHQQRGGAGANRQPAAGGAGRSVRGRGLLCHAGDGGRGDAAVDDAGGDVALSCSPSGFMNSPDSTLTVNFRVRAHQCSLAKRCIEQSQRHIFCPTRNLLLGKSPVYLSA